MESFIASLAQPSIPHWDALPDLDLYMDQVIAFMEKYLSLFGDSRDKLITPSMINNYVKLGVLPPPVKKKIQSGTFGPFDDHLYAKAGAAHPCAGPSERPDRGPFQPVHGLRPVCG